MVYNAYTFTKTKKNRRWEDINNEYPALGSFRQLGFYSPNLWLNCSFLLSL